MTVDAEIQLAIIMLAKMQIAMAVQVAQMIHVIIRIVLIQAHVRMTIVLLQKIVLHLQVIHC